MSQKRILVIDDNDQVREVLKLSLEFDGHEVLMAANGEEAFKVLAQNSKPGLILLDLMMPIMNGWEFMKALKNDKRLKNIPVLVVSAYLDTEEESSEPIQCEGVVEKPLNLKLLASQIELHYKDVV